MRQPFIALLCNGSTADSGSVCLGSSPSGATILIFECLWILIYRI